jgi:tetratricopeptide (TPR) repeat protein
VGDALGPRMGKVALILSPLPALACLTQEISSRPGYESSLVLSPFLAVLGGAAAVSVVRRLRGLGGGASPPRAAAALGALSLAVLMPPFLVLLLGAAIRGSCGLADGVCFYLVGPAGCVLAALTAGMIVGLSVRRGWSAYVLWAAAAAGFFLWDVAVFYFTPKVNVYDHLLGYFAGPLWDEAVRVDARLWVFRAVTLAVLAAIHAAVWPSLDAALTLSSRRMIGTRRGAASLLALLVVIAAAHAVQVREGISPSRRMIEKELSRVVRAGGAVMYLPAGVTDAQAELLRLEVLFRQEQLEKFFGVRPGTVRLYFFPSVESMKRFTGTGPTSVTKLWLNEAYMVFAPPPHPVLKHELAHLFTARWGSGPLRLPGSLWGTASDPVLVEGTAVAAEWPCNPVPPHLAAAASMKGGLLAGWDPFSSLGFFSTNSGLSYQASGSFVRFVRDMWGSGALAAWYGGASFRAAVGVSGEDAVRLWREFLASQEVEPGLVAEMKRLYASPSIFRRTCPHAVAGLAGEAGACMAQGDVACGLERFAAIEELDVGNPLHALHRLQWLSSMCRAPAGEIEALLEGGRLSGYQTLGAHALCGDVAWAAGDAQRASACYGKALAEAYDDYDLRLLRIKAWAVEEGGEISALYRRYLVCDEGAPAQTSAAKLGPLLAALLVQPGQPVTYYLVGRNLFNEESHEAAAAFIEKALSLFAIDPESPFPEDEALLVLADCYLRTPGKAASARPILDELLSRKDLSPSEKFRAGEMKEYLAFLDFQGL